MNALEAHGSTKKKMIFHYDIFVLKFEEFDQKNRVEHAFKKKYDIEIRIVHMILEAYFNLHFA